MKITVIIPVYNKKEYLDRCLDSVLAQDEKDLEIILSDDGSTDGSGDLCEAYAARDSRIRVIRGENGGVSAARNRALDCMTGEYVCFIDADDSVARGYLSLLLNLLSEERCSIAVCGLTKQPSSAAEYKTAVLSAEEARLSLFDEKGGIRGYIGGKMLRADIIRQNRIRFDEGQTIAEDLIFLYDYLNCCPGDRCVAVSDAALYCYYVDSASALQSRGQSDRFHEKWCDGVNACDKIIARIPQEQKRLRKAAELEKVMQCVTLIRLAARYGERARVREYRRYAAKKLCPYLLSRNHSFRKRIGAAAVVICPYAILKRR